MVLGGEVFVEASHITSLGWGDGRYLPVWTAFPWVEFNQWRHSQKHDGAPSKVAKVQEYCPPVEPLGLHVGVWLKGAARLGHNVNDADTTFMTRLQTAEFRNEVEVLAAPQHSSQGASRKDICCSLREALSHWPVWESLTYIIEKSQSKNMKSNNVYVIKK